MTRLESIPTVPDASKIMAFLEHFKIDSAQIRKLTWTPGAITVEHDTDNGPREFYLTETQLPTGQMTRKVGSRQADQ